MELLGESSRTDTIVMLLRYPFSRVLPNASSGVLKYFTAKRAGDGYLIQRFQDIIPLPQITGRGKNLKYCSSMNSSSGSSNLVSPYLKVEPYLE